MKYRYIPVIAGLIGLGLGLGVWQTPATAQFSTSNPTSFSFNATSAPVVQNASYAAGQSVGGLLTVQVGNTPGVLGQITQLSTESKGGSTVQLDIYIWDANPVNTTCTDKANFVVSIADNAHLVLQKSLTPAVYAGAQDTHTYAFTSGLTANFKSDAKSIYVCVLAHASVTPATTSDVRFNFQGNTYVP